MAVGIGQITITHLLDGSHYEEQYASSLSYTEAPDSGWSFSIPAPEANYYIWRKTRKVNADGTYGPWSDAIRITGVIGEKGEAGPSGNPGSIGVNIDSSTIIVSGFDSEGEFGYPTGTIYLGTSRYLLDETSYTVTTSGQGYILANASGLIRFAKLEAETSLNTSSKRMVWRDFNSNVEITSDVVIGRFLVEDLIITNAEITPAMSLEQFVRSQFMEILRNSNADSAQLQALAEAMNIDKIFQSIVAMEAFIKNLWVSRLESEQYTVDPNGYPDTGFHLDGITGVAKIASLMAKNADVFGRFNSDGFRTIDKVTGTTIPSTSIDPTIFKYSEMCELIPTTDSRSSISGTIEDYTFNLATRRNNQRVLLHSLGSASANVSPAGGFSDPKILNRITPIWLFGSLFRVEWSLSYTNNFAQRRLWRSKTGQTAKQMEQDLDYRENIGTSDEPSYIYPEKSEGELWFSGKGSGEYAGSYSINSTRPDFTIWVRNGGLWGSGTATCKYLRVLTNQTFNGLVLTDDNNSYKFVAFQPDAYYLSSSKPFEIDSINQDSSTLKKYCSGSDFYDLFSNVPVGTNSAATGEIKINGKNYVVSRLRKDADRIVFFTGTEEVFVSKFINGTSSGVYTELEIINEVVLGAMDGGIESMWIVPWLHATYDIGQTLKRFRSMYLSNELISGSIQTGPINASTVNANTVYGAVFN
jgi:hypothetical protein